MRPSGTAASNSLTAISYLTLSEKEWRRRRVECDKCGLNLSAASLNKHLETQHGVFRSRVLNRDFLLENREPVTFTAHASMGGNFFCPVPACQDATDSYDTAWALRRHFRDRHPRDFVDVGALGNLPKCQLCNMQADPQRAASHEKTKLCREGRERIVQTNAAIANQRALEVGFTAYGEDLERVE
eukprot:scaffold13763_cov160-Skeletonema_dohrnii-CCMP3373.AAC.1